MKNFLKRLPKKAFVAIVTLAIVAGAASSALAGFGPERPTRTWTAAEDGFDHVTFNSYTGVPDIGDERDFLRGVQVGRDDTWSDPVVGVDHEAEVEMKILIHNNANPELNDAPGNPGIAKNVTVRAELPTTSAQAHEVTAHIAADNAQPKSIFDTLNITGADNGYFELAYVPGSAKLHTAGNATALSDNLVTTGVNIGDQKGCFEYIREITFRVKVKMPSWATQKVARLHGEDSSKWREAVNAKAGDKIDYRIWFKNAGTTQLNDVKVVDDVPTFMKATPGTVKLYNNNHPAPTGFTYSDNAVQKNGTQVNIDIGSYAPGADAYVVFTAEIEKAETLECGVHQLINVAYTTPDGYGAASDKAYVNIVNDECEEPEAPTYICESLTVEKLGGRKVRATVKAPTSGDASVKTVTYNYGDGSTAKVTNKLVDEYEYKTDGTYKITATVVFTVEGTDKSVTSENCAKMVTFSSEKPSELPKTGAGSVIGLFTATSVAGAAVHNVISRRRY